MLIRNDVSYGGSVDFHMEVVRLHYKAVIAVGGWFLIIKVHASSPYRDPDEVVVS